VSGAARLGASMEAERREYLKQYILACIRSSVLSWNDLASPDVVQKLLGVVSRDTKAVLADLGRTAGAGLLRTIGTALGGIAADVVSKQNRR